MNLTLLDNNSNVSPFDSIRRYDEHGQEYWSARELMLLLGYDKWQNFHKNIKRAYISCQNSQNDATTHFLLTSVKSLGRNADEWKLSRYACYLIAMNGDPTKTEIAQAQSYFAVKTREAEVIIPKQNEQLKELELKLQVLKAEKEVAIAQQKLLDTRHMIVNTCPEPVQQKILGYQVVKEVERVEVVIDNKTGEESDGVGITYVSKMLGFGTNTQKCWGWLDRVGYGKNSGKWQNELTAIHTPKLSRDEVQYLKDIFNDYRQGQQLFLGE